MATYTFQQNYPSGASNGYVRCEMTPGPGETPTGSYVMNLTVFDKSKPLDTIVIGFKPPAGVTGNTLYRLSRQKFEVSIAANHATAVTAKINTRTWSSVDLNIIPDTWKIARMIDCPIQLRTRDATAIRGEGWVDCVGTSSQTIRLMLQRLDPRIIALDFKRVVLSGQEWVESDEGTAIMGDLAFSAVVGEYGLTVAKFDIVCSDGTTSTVNLTQAQIEAAMASGGISETQPGIFANVLFDASKKYTVTLTIGDQFETVSQQFELSDAFTNLHLSGCGKGVAVGKYSASTVSAPLFECQYPAKFYDDVAVAADGLFKLVDVANTSTVPSGSSNFSRTLTSTDFTNAVADGYVPVALAGFSINSYLWFVYNCGMSTSGVTMAVTRRDSSTGSSASMTLSAKVLMVKMI